MRDDRSDRDIQRLRALLGKTAPEDPATTDRAEAVASRARQARRRLGAAGAIAVTSSVALLVIAPHWIPASPTTNDATVTGGVGTSPTNFAADPCPPTPVRVRGQSVQSSLLPADPVSVRLCRAQIDGHTSPWTPPLDALVEHPEDFVAAISQMRASPPLVSCALPQSREEPFALRLNYQDRQSIVLASSAALCPGLDIGGVRVLPSAVLAQFQQALLRQRADLAPPAVVVEPDCRTDVSSTWRSAALADPIGATSVTRSTRSALANMTRPRRS